MLKMSVVKWVKVNYITYFLELYIMQINASFRHWNFTLYISIVFQPLNSGIVFIGNIFLNRENLLPTHITLDLATSKFIVGGLSVVCPYPDSDCLLISPLFCNQHVQNIIHVFFP